MYFFDLFYKSNPKDDYMYKDHKDFAFKRDYMIMNKPNKKVPKIVQRILDDFEKMLAEDDVNENEVNTCYELTESERQIIVMAVTGEDENGYVIEDWDKVIKPIVAKNREHLDALIGYVRCIAESEAGLAPLCAIVGMNENVVDLGVTVDLNFLDVSNVTDMSGLFKDFDVSPHPERGWFCKIRLDISKWNVSNVTKMAHMFDCQNVDFGDLSRWNRSKVADC